MYRSIHWLRGLAALLVVATHAFPSFALGKIGVDLFFIISGFVMVVCTDSATHPLALLRARAGRVLPMWWTALAIYLAVTMAVSGGGWIPHLTVTPPDQAAASALLVPYFSEMNGRYTAYNIGWTLLFEAFFYTVFAAALALGSRLYAFAPLVVMAAVGIAGAEVFYANTIVLEFAAGMLIALFLRTPPLWLLAVIPAGLYLMAGTERGEMLSQLRVIELGIPAAMFCIGALSVERHLPRVRALDLFGNASYSVYLFHMVAYMAVGEIVGYQAEAFPVLAFISGALIGVAAHVFIENPLTRCVRGRINHAPASDQ